MITLSFSFDQITKLLIMLPICVAAIWFLAKITVGATKEAREDIIKLRNEINTKGRNNE